MSAPRKILSTHSTPVIPAWCASLHLPPTQNHTYNASPCIVVPAQEAHPGVPRLGAPSGIPLCPSLPPHSPHAPLPSILSPPHPFPWPSWCPLRYPPLPLLMSHHKHSFPLLFSRAGSSSRSWSTATPPRRSAASPRKGCSNCRGSNQGAAEREDKDKGVCSRAAAEAHDAVWLRFAAPPSILGGPF